jgi:hypothetical protein
MHSSLAPKQVLIGWQLANAHSFSALQVFPEQKQADPAA